MLRKTAVVVVTALALAGCEKEQSSEDAEAPAPAPAEVPSGPVTAADPSECSAASDDGSVAIFDGLDATILQNGYGRVAVLGDDVIVKATLWVVDESAEGGKGELVWDSGPDGFAFRIGDNRFIKGWSPGIACMMLGEKRELVIASELAYGEAGRAPIPPNADIVYDLELIGVSEPES